MNNKSSILNLVRDYVKILFSSKKIGDLKYELQEVINIPRGNKYNDYTLEQFLCLYKIDQLMEYRIISSSIANKLCELFDAKIKVRNKIGNLLANEVLCEGNNFKSNMGNYAHQIKLLEQKEKEIDDILEKYQLVIKDEDYLKIFLNLLTESEYYDLIDEKELDLKMKNICKDI